MYCPYCRQQLKETDRFCTRCGKRLPVGVPAPSAPQPLAASPTASAPLSAREAQPAAPKVPKAKAAPAPVVPGSPVPVAMAIVACLLALGAVAVLLLAPLVSITPDVYKRQSWLRWARRFAPVTSNCSRGFSRRRENG